jgi:hypothetical protein
MMSIGDDKVANRTRAARSSTRRRGKRRAMPIKAFTRRVPIDARAIARES